MEQIRSGNRDLHLLEDLSALLNISIFL